MRKLLSSPVEMSLSETENQIYQSALSHATELSLNLMAVKVTDRPDNFVNWCGELLRLCRHDLKIDLLEPNQLPILKKLQDTLETGFSVSQFKIACSAPWATFASFIEQQATIHALEERLKLLAYTNDLRATPLAEMLEEDRLVFAGKHTAKHDHSIYNFDVEWFASTKGAKVFHILLQSQPSDFDAALAHIPLEGEVTAEQYQAFVAAYSKIFTSYTESKAAGEKAPLAPATRLLAMRRPDQFIALTNGKIAILCQGLSIAKFTGFNFDAYWQDMIGTLRTLTWWNQEQPSDEASLNIWNARAILIDLFIYADESLAQGSNYLKLRDKTLKNKGRASASSVARKRSKESAEMLVDKALTADDMPAYMQSKRDSIINSVKDGKSVEHAIGLMRAIFG